MHPPYPRTWCRWPSSCPQDSRLPLGRLTLSMSYSRWTGHVPWFMLASAVSSFMAAGRAQGECGTSGGGCGWQEVEGAGWGERPGLWGDGLASPSPSQATSPLGENQQLCACSEGTLSSSEPARVLWGQDSPRRASPGTSGEGTGYTRDPTAPPLPSILLYHVVRHTGALHRPGKWVRSSSYSA